VRVKREVFYSTITEFVTPVKEVGLIKTFLNATPNNECTGKYFSAKFRLRIMLYNK